MEECLSFVEQLLSSMEPALRVASASEIDSGSGNKEGSCCGTGCGEAGCLKYLAGAVEGVGKAINGTMKGGKEKAKFEL